MCIFKFCFLTYMYIDDLENIFYVFWPLFHTQKGLSHRKIFQKPDFQWQVFSVTTSDFVQCTFHLHEVALCSAEEKKCSCL